MKTKQLFSLLILSLFVISAINAVSAKVYIAGVTYNAIDSNNIFPEGDVSVIVSCTHNNVVTTKPATSNSTDGTYAVSFRQSGPKECDVGYTVTVSGSKGGLSGNASGIVHGKSSLGIDMNLGIVNVPLVPEFGIFIGALTILSAMVMFFVIRRQ